MRTEATLRTALRWLVLAILLASVIAPCTAQTAEHRALWVFAWGPGFKDSTEVGDLVERARIANCNVIVAQVRKSGDAYYFPTRPNRDVRATGIEPDYDPLLELCTQAHDQGIHVYAWVAAERIASALPGDPDHLMNRHPDWITKTISGGTYFTDEGYYSDPGHPGAAEWNYNVAMDLIRHYPIDGLVFDYVRYPSPSSGYNETALNRFRARYGHPSTFIPNYTDPLWSVWRREQVTHFIRKVYANALAIKPGVVIGASTIGDRSDAYSGKFQDWRSWMLGGILDCNYPMIYTTSNTTFTSRVGDAVANGGSRWTYALQGSYMNTISNTMTQIGLARTNGAKGIGIYRYCFTNKDDANTSVDDEPAFYSALAGQAFTQPVSQPAMPWKTSPTVGHIKGTIIDPFQGAGLDAAWISISPAGGGGGYGAYSDGTGFYAYMNLAPGNYNITVSKGTFVRTKPVTITAGRIETVDFLTSGTEPGSIAAAKQMPDGTGVALPPMTVSAGNNQLQDRLYIEDQDHAAGIRVELSGNTDVIAYPGDVVKVYGTLGTSANGERCITNPIVHTIETDGPRIRPLGIRSKDLSNTSVFRPSGVDMYKVGLLVEVAGKVTAVDTSAECFYVDDGCSINDESGAVGLRIDYSDLAEGSLLTPPQINDTVRVRGISNVESISGRPRCTVVLREQDDVSTDSGTILQAPPDTLQAGWNLISIPGTPLDPSPPAVFSPSPVDGKLLRWDNRTQGLLLYDSWALELFGGIMRGDGYWLIADDDNPLSMLAYSNSPTDFIIALPRAGWTLLGNPFATERAWGDALVTNGLEVQPLVIAAHSRLWLNSTALWWDSQTQGLNDMGLPEDFVPCETMQPWHGYWIRTYVDDLSLILQ